MKKRYFFFFLTAVLANLALFGLGAADIFDGWPLYQIPLFEMGWLYGLARSLGLPVEGKGNEVAVLPNMLGWGFVVLGSLITVAVYALAARLLFRSRASRQ